MRAVTHTEVYRRFGGTLRTHPLRFWPIVAAGIRVGTKRKLPMLLLYAPVAIATVIFSFLTYSRFAAEAGIDAIGGLEGGMANLMARRALQQLQVEKQIVAFHHVMVWFSLLATAWYGTGLFAEDRRVGAHQLYFSRPITKLDYFVGKFLTVSFFSGLVLIVPDLIVCTVASVSSPEWSFLTDHWDVILHALLYSTIWVVVSSSIALCFSSLSNRRIFALVGMFAFFVMTFGAAGLLGETVDERFFLISPIVCAWTVGAELFGVDAAIPGVSCTGAVVSLASMVVLALGIVALRLRKLEVVA